MEIRIGCREICEAVSRKREKPLLGTTVRARWNSGRLAGRQDAEGHWTMTFEEVERELAPGLLPTEISVGRREVVENLHRLRGLKVAPLTVCKWWVSGRLPGRQDAEGHWTMTVAELVQHLEAGLIPPPRVNARFSVSASEMREAVLSGRMPSV